MTGARLLAVRVLGVLVVAFGLVYIGWRWSSSVPWGAWWIGVPLVIAETYSLGESVLFALTMWNARRRSLPAPPPAGLTVDVFIATYNEPLEIVLHTALAARDMTYPHSTWILDDGDRPEFRRAAERIRVGYINRGPEWDGRPRFAKAGNINNALFRTSGEFIAILDSDQVPEPQFLDRVLGYFVDDHDVAFVQTPQHFWNVERADVLGSGAELFYGPIQQGKDGWGAAFFCGSNAVLRREALMALGLTRFSRSARGRMRAALRMAYDRMCDLRAELALRDPAHAPIAERAVIAVERAEDEFRRGEVLSEVAWQLRTDLRGALADAVDPSPSLLRELDAALEAVEVSHTDQALALSAIDTTTVTEDMATAMHLHSMGWTSVYHDEVLVHGLAPEDVATMLGQRKRWAAGSMQVFFSDNPLFVTGLTAAQRLMYLATMTSYLNGFAAVVYLLAPVVFLLSGVFPLAANATTFLIYFVPFFLLSQLMFQVSGWGSRGLWRGQQMSFALFPTWISATIAGWAASFLGRHLAFSVTSKAGGRGRGADYRSVAPQLVALLVLMAATAVGVVRCAIGVAPLVPTLLTLAWVALDVALLSIAIRAARYRGPSDRVVAPSALPEEGRALLAELGARSSDSPARSSGVPAAS